MLAQSVVSEFGGRARFVVENYGESALARRFGVTRYPAIFVDDVLVATPKDFGFFGKGEGEDGGRYAPLRSAASHERFRADLARVIRQLLAGRRDLARAAGVPAHETGLAAFPGVTFQDLDGRAIPRDSLRGRVVVVEFWATWCPPCRGTLTWLETLKRRWGGRLAVVTVALESDPADVRALASRTGAPFVWTMATPQVARAFGDVSAVPTMHVFAPDGRAAATWFGAPPGLHEQAEASLATLLDKR